MFESIQRAEDIIKKSGANILEEGMRAFYQKLMVLITVPDRIRFQKGVEFVVALATPMPPEEQKAEEVSA